MTAGTEQTFEKAVKNWQDKPAADDHKLRKRMTALMLSFFYAVTFIHKLDIIGKEYVIRLHIFAVAVLPNIIKIDQQWTETE